MQHRRRYRRCRYDHQLPQRPRSRMHRSRLRLRRHASARGQLRTRYGGRVSSPIRSAATCSAQLADWTFADADGVAGGARSSERLHRSSCGYGSGWFVVGSATLCLRSPQRWHLGVRRCTKADLSLTGHRKTTARRPAQIPHPCHQLARPARWSANDHAC